MTGTPQRLVVAESAPQNRMDSSEGSVAGWKVLGWGGLLFFIVGTTDIALLWYPAFFGDPQWEFGTVTNLLNGLPATTIGLAMMAASALARERARSARLVATIIGFFALVVIVASVLYLTDIPIALRESSSNALVLLGIKKSIVKTTVQAIIYPIVLISMAVMIWRRAVSASQN